MSLYRQYAANTYAGVVSPGVSACDDWYARLGSNQRPSDPESGEGHPEPL